MHVRWEAGDKQKRRAYLPEDKQFLIIRNGALHSHD